ncbi:MAG: SRPBCC family protein [Weeksellaceae bacterium]
MINTTFQSGIYQLKSEQIIHAPIDEVWEYFSQPKNLNDLTPPDMGFTITSGEPPKMYEGQIVTYKIEILPGIKQNWVTEIKHVENQKLFIDEQRFGPYAMWHHEHHFEAISDNQVKMNDIVSYKLPLGFIGNLVAGKMIKKRVHDIFAYRHQKVSEIFGEPYIKDMN